jgi:thiamine biosynthesis protein ThiI
LISAANDLASRRQSEDGNKPRIVLVSTSEFALKSGAVRRQLQSRLIEHLKVLLKRNGIDTHRASVEGGRIVIELGNDAEDAARICSRVFGVSWAAPAFRIQSEREALAQRCLEIAESRLRPESTFAIRAHRSDPRALDSKELERYAGHVILERFKDRGIRVDLDEPDLTIRIELKSKDSFIYVDRWHGSAGLPVGSQGKMLGILTRLAPEGLVAFHLMLRRGAAIVPVSFVDRELATRYLARLRALLPNEKYSFWQVGGVAEFAKHADESAGRLAPLIVGRLMVRVLNEIARREKAVAFVDSYKPTDRDPLVLLQAVSELALVPVHRPLVGLSETEIDEYARSFSLDDRFEVSAVAPGIAQRLSAVDLTEIARIEMMLGAEQTAKRMFAEAEKVLVPLGYDADRI